jgi:glycine/serine hydroxymethyltransferase
MHPTITYKLAKAQTADLHQQAQRTEFARAARHQPERVPARRTVDGARCQALFASGLQPSDAPGADTVTEAIRATVALFGSRGCAIRMAQEFGDHPEAATERMRWARSLLSWL